MNEVLLLFTYSPLLLADAYDIISLKAQELKLKMTTVQFSKSGDDESLIAYLDEDVSVSFMPSAVLVNIPVFKYRDFTRTLPVWKHLEQILSSIGINPIVWTFSKSNRFVLTSPVTNDNRQQVLELILSGELLQSSGVQHLYVEESIDKTRVFTCRYGFEKYKNFDSLSLKTMISTQSYQVEGLADQVLITNGLMFDVWHWAVSNDLLAFMDNPKEDVK